MGVSAVILGKLVQTGRIGGGFHKIVVQPPVRQSVGIANLIDRVFHGRSSVDHSIHIGGHVAKTIARQNSGTADQNDFGRDCFAVALSVFFGKRFQVGVKVVLCKVLG